MLAAILTTAIAIGVGPLNSHGEVGKVNYIPLPSTHVAFSLPPRAEMVVKSGGCKWLDYPRVATNYADGGISLPRGRWTQDHTVEMFGSVAFDGISFTNYSFNHWATIEAHVFDGCSSSN